MNIKVLIMGKNGKIVASDFQLIYIGIEAIDQALRNSGY